MNLLFHDVDGCLNLTSGASIPLASNPYPIELQTLLSSLGKLIDDSDIDSLIINTGRSLADTLPLVPLINSRKLHYLIVEHGAIIFNLIEEQLVHQPDEIAHRLTSVKQFIKWYDDVGNVLLEQSIGCPVTSLEKEFNLTLLAPNGLEDQQLFNAVTDLIDDSPYTADDFVLHHSRSDRLIDVMSGVDKGDGVRLICEQYPTSNPSTFAIGNGVNDLPMMRAVEAAICPANAEPEMLDYCSRGNGIVSEHHFGQCTLHWLKQRVVSDLSTTTGNPL